SSSSNELVISLTDSAGARTPRLSARPTSDAVSVQGGDLVTAFDATTWAEGTTSGGLLTRGSVRAVFAAGWPGCGSSIINVGDREDGESASARPFGRDATAVDARGTAAGGPTALENGGGFAVVVRAPAFASAPTT